jgi:anaerobic magnesium-protoporphyrin IX monomethyl ester cyclase
LIILTHGYFLEEDPKELAIMKPYVPLGLLYISAYLESSGITHEVFDSTFSDFSSFKKNLQAKQPKLLGLYTNLMTKINVLKIIDFVKSEAMLRDCKIILGGPEIRYNAENYLKQGADLLVVGEGEQTFFEICDTFLKTGELSFTLDGTASLQGKELVFKNERVLLKDINTLPMPARKNIDLALYGEAWKKHHGYSMYSVSTMRGCPYTCKWCSRAVYGGTYRRRSAKLVVDELEYLKNNYQPDRIWFVDDVFTINHKWLREFKEEILSRKIIIPYEIITRADRMNEEVIAILQQTGCFRVWIGAESGSQKIVDAMDRRVDVAVVRDMIIKTKKAGIEAGTFIMLGYPGENKTDIKETIRHLQLADPSFYTITVAYPITGTPLYNEVSASLKAEGNWAGITDRDYDFKRKHTKKYYQYAVRWVYNEVNFKKTSGVMNKVKFKTKSFLAQALMMIS